MIANGDAEIQETLATHEANELHVRCSGVGIFGLYLLYA